MTMIIHHDHSVHSIPSSYKSDEAEIDYKIVAIIKTSDNKENRIEREINILALVVQRLNVNQIYLDILQHIPS